MSDQDNGQITTLQRPTTNDINVWKIYWNAQGQSWRTEPEIDIKRQEELEDRRQTQSDIEKGIYPFKDIKLNRADVEWLLATHENGRGPIDWNDVSQRTREGINVREADLRLVDLRGLPLARLIGGLTEAEWNEARVQPRTFNTIHMEQADLRGTHLEGAILNRAHFEEASLSRAHLECAKLTAAQLQHARLQWSHLEGAQLILAHFENAHLRGANLSGANLASAYLEKVRLEETILCDRKGVSPNLVDVYWEGTNLSVINWASIKMLGNELTAKKSNHLHDYQTAVRAYRQLAVVLQEQGLNEDASRFSYRAQRLQRIVLRLQKKFVQYIFAIFLDLLAGYGYRTGRSVIWYLVTIFGFALAYFVFGHLPFFPDALVFSLTSFHGRGFFPGLGSENSLHNPLVILAAFEAIIGLLIEISFIATFTQRFFGR